MNPFILVRDIETFTSIIVATRDIVTVTQIPDGACISFSGMHHDIETIDTVPDIWRKITRKEDFTHG